MVPLTQAHTLETPLIKDSPLQDFIRAFDNGATGPDSVLVGLRAIESGAVATCTWIVSQHPNEGDTVVSVVTIGRAIVDEVLSWRVCNGTNPDGAGSYALCPSVESQDLSTAAVRLAYRLALAGPWIFRQPLPGETFSVMGSVAYFGGL